jgi:hypothetical protein
MEDYKAQLHERITRLHAETKRGELPRKLRFVKIGQLTEDYFENTDEIPDVISLERLSSLCLYEELTDPNPDKMTTEEYPIMSDTQRARRIEGKHRKKEANYRIEVPLGIAENRGTDGRMHDLPTKRERSERENRFIDEEARSRNEDRKESYNAFIHGKSQGMFSINIASGEKMVTKNER